MYKEIGHVAGGGLYLYRLRSSRRLFSRIYCSFILWFLGRALASASLRDREIRQELEFLPENFGFALQVAGNGPAMVVTKNGDGTASYLGGAAAMRGRKLALTMRVKTLASAVLLFTFREGTAVSMARDRFATDGPLPETCTIVRALNRLETLLLPGCLARRAVKRYRKPSGLFWLRVSIYLGTFFGRRGKR
ncbi:hypothetical protein [Sediminispirochaeta bajacaliforniensis]|uniref:hypothetical protein n=1 Tax=Sediminispirochaeta bajacaliforniensis TaxID=148 RepID=UPI00037248C2|nr:hypothetical protein [Sediminispirochaeta bajacaliforniensis]